MRALLIVLALTACKPRPDARLPLLAPSPMPETLPDPLLDWLVESRGAPLAREALLRAFDDKWRRDHDAVRIYGWSRAIVVLPEDESPIYSRVGVAMRLVTASGDDELRLAGAPELTRFRDEVAARLRAAGAADVDTPRSPDQGAADCKRLAALFTANGTEVQLRVIAPDAHPFPGARVGEVLRELGLAAGDDGQIHFDGFTAGTHSPPGRLDAATLGGKVQLADLFFEMYVPHVDRPVERFALLRRAAEYAAQRLDGRLVARVETFGHAQSADLPAAEKKVRDTSAALAAGGFPAGAPSTVRLFRLP